VVAVPPVADRGIVVRRVDVHPAPELVFETLYGSSDTAFWLDGSAGDRFSFMGDAAGPLARVATCGKVRRPSRDERFR
jgi:para-aminobenzoate synthetase